jgi:hypothetical protein
MESVCVGAFILVFLVAAIVIASPISLAAGAITYSVRKSDPRRILHAMIVAVLILIFVVLLACVVLLVWNPRI